MVECAHNTEENIGSVIAIDWGNEESSVSVCKDGRLEVVENEDGKLFLPSYIAFDPNGGNVFFGEAAKDQLLENRENTIYNLTRLVGLTFNEAVRQSEIESLPFNIIELNDRPHIQVNTAHGEKKFTTEQATAMIFRDLKKRAEAHLNKTVTHALVAIPGNFNDAQRRAIVDAGTIARLKVIHLMNESTAAAIGREIRGDGDKVENVLVFKLGSGSFDVRLMEISSSIQGQKIEVIGSDGDTQLGGNEFNRRIMTEYIRLYNEREIGKTHGNPDGNKIDMQLLNIAVEKTKCNLSDGITDCILYPTFYRPLKRSRFEELNADLFESTIKIVKSVLEDARMDVNQVDRVILVGGSTRIPKIRESLKDLFVGKEITFATKEEVSVGAAKQAAILSGESDRKTLSVSEVTALSLGTEVVAEEGPTLDLDMSVIIPRNTTIPTKKTEKYSTFVDNQSSANIDIYEGEHNKVRKNHFLDKFRLSGLTPAPARVTKFKVTMELDVLGILNVTAKEDGKDNQNQISIDYNRVRFSKADIDRMMKENEELIKYEE